MPDDKTRGPEPLPDDIVRQIRNRWHSLTTDRERRALLNHMRRSLEMFDDVLREVQGGR
jgi:hypothetical protein